MKETLVFLQALGMMVLVFSGLAGIAYNVFRDGGWLEAAVSNVYAMKYPLLMIFIIACGIVVIKLWRYDHSTHGHKRKGPTVVLYALMVAGAYYIGHFATYGTL